MAAQIVTVDLPSPYGDDPKDHPPLVFRIDVPPIPKPGRVALVRPPYRSDASIPLGAHAGIVVRVGDPFAVYFRRTFRVQDCGRPLSAPEVEDNERARRIHDPLPHTPPALDDMQLAEAILPNTVRLFVDGYTDAGERKLIGDLAWKAVVADDLELLLGRAFQAITSHGGIGDAGLAAAGYAPEITGPVIARARASAIAGL